MAASVVFMGTPAFAIPVLEALLQLDCRVVGVFTQPDRPGGRGQALTPPPVKRFALGRGLKVLQPPSLRGEAQRQQLQALAPDLVVVAAYGLFLPSALLSLPPGGCLNVHPSLLPKYRGPSPVVQALLEGEEWTGVSLMLVDTGMDSGPLLAQERVRVEPQDTAAILTLRLFQRGAELLKQVLLLWLEGRVVAQPQDPAQATYTRLVRKEDGAISWQAPASRIERMVRAYDSWPGAYTHWKGKRLKLLAGKALPALQLPGPPGMVVAWEQDGEAQPAVVTGEGLLVLRRVQIEGRQPVSGEEFLRGYRGILGVRLPS